MKKLMMLFVALLTLAAATPAAHAKRSIMELPLFERAVLIIKKFETLHKPKHWPTIGFGHVVQRGEPYRKGIQLTERQADALLRKDLRKFVSLYKHMGERNAILLGTLAYNIGPGAVNKSSVYRKLKNGNRDIYKEYTAHCHYKGKFHKQLYIRRKTEIVLLFL
ncbi:MULTISPECIES: glycoside hydrolase family protein [Bacteroidales]|uniref:glycoside hydrolase family protein n=1 Tax=Bacteroidales TaxID=171549 RepID=UPI001FF08854|nr:MULTISPECIES: glycoside hydrolase family protein [Bacteroidales]